jgi:hypothetical protein
MMNKQRETVSICIQNEKKKMYVILKISVSCVVINKLIFPPLVMWGSWLEYVHSIPCRKRGGNGAVLWMRRKLQQVFAW